MRACMRYILMRDTVKKVKMRERQRDERTGKIEWIRRMSVEE